MSKIIKVIDERETQEQTNKKNRTRVTESVAKGGEINDFVERLS